MKHRFARPVLFAIAVALAPAVATAQSFNIDCGIGNAVPASTFSAATVQAGVWNGADCASLGATPLVDINGAPTGVTLSIAGTNFNLYFANPDTAGDDGLLLDDGQDLSGSGGTTWTIGPMAAGTYAVTVYAWAPDIRGDRTAVTVAGGSNGPMICGLSQGFAGYVLGETHVRDTLSVPAGGSIVITADGPTPADFGTLDGLQIERLPAGQTTYCSAGTSSHGCVAAIYASANPSVSTASACVITATGVEARKNGILLYGIDNTGFAPSPWGSGNTSFLCIKPPMQRMSALSSGGTLGACNGVFVEDWNAYHIAHPGAYGTPFTAGGSVFVQAWYRDPPAPTTTNLSNAVQMTFVP